MSEANLKLFELERAAFALLHHEAHRVRRLQDGDDPGAALCAEAQHVIHYFEENGIPTVDGRMPLDDLLVLRGWRERQGLLGTPESA